MKKVTSTLKKGFTLIELLVVIAIIGLLSSIVLASLSSARTKAKTAKFISELDQLLLAIQLYREDNNGVYPDPYGSLVTAVSPWHGELDLLVSQGYIPDLPRHSDFGYRVNVNEHTLPQTGYFCGETAGGGSGDPVGYFNEYFGDVAGTIVIYNGDIQIGKGSEYSILCADPIYGYNYCNTVLTYGPTNPGECMSF